MDLLKITKENDGLNVSKFDYYLPETLIAQHPVDPRDASRLMVLNRDCGRIEHHTFRDLVSLLKKAMCLCLITPALFRRV